MDLLKKKLMKTTNGNTTWDVFKAYVLFFFGLVLLLVLLGVLPRVNIS